MKSKIGLLAAAAASLWSSPVHTYELKPSPISNPTRKRNKTGRSGLGYGHTFYTRGMGPVVKDAYDNEYAVMKDGSIRRK